MWRESIEGIPAFIKPCELPSRRRRRRRVKIQKVYTRVHDKKEEVGEKKEDELYNIH